jgi:hypothetical protein
MGGNLAGHAGVNLPAPITQAQLQMTELQAILKQITAFHPSGGGDATNYAAISVVPAELATSPFGGCPTKRMLRKSPCYRPSRRHRRTTLASSWCD